MGWWRFRTQRQWEERPRPKRVNSLLGIDLKELVSIKDLCASGELPISEKDANLYCSKHQHQKMQMLAAFKIGKEWYTYRQAVRWWLFGAANESMREYAMKIAEERGELAREEYSLPGLEPFPNQRRFSLKIYCETPLLPVSYRSMIKYCDGRAQPKLKAVKHGGHWMTSRLLIMHWYAQCANHAVNYANSRKETWRSPWLEQHEFLSLKKLCEEGTLPLKYQSMIRFCLNKKYKGSEKPAMPAWKIDGQWYTTKEMLGIWIVRQGNFAADCTFDPRLRSVGR